MPEARTILRIDRERSSRSGNPRFRFTFTDGSMAKSAPDAGWAYAVGNRGMREGSTVALEAASGEYVAIPGDMTHDLYSFTFVPRELLAR
jgi:hypothetical protein